MADFRHANATGGSSTGFEARNVCQPNAHKYLVQRLVHASDEELTTWLADLPDYRQFETVTNKEQW